MSENNVAEISFFCDRCGNEVTLDSDSGVLVWSIEPCVVCLKEEYLKGFKAKHQRSQGES